MSQATMIEPPTDGSMSLMEHLVELRTRLIWIIGTLLVGTVFALFFAEPIIEFIVRPLTEIGVTAQAIGPTDTVGVYFKVSFTVGAAFAMPVIVYQLIAFISPGLYPNEKRALILTLPGVMILFGLGAAFAFYLLIPAAVDFLQNFLGSVIRQDWTIERYIGFITRLVFWMGVAFETPLVVAFLARAGLITGPRLLSYWRHAIVVVAILAAAITPTVDPVNMTIVMGPLLVLYFFSVGLAYIVYRPRTPRTFDDDLKGEIEEKKQD
jgi:sec-independent protein translocase protein TatC